jgi:Tfp pilus assembly protein PilV
VRLGPAQNRTASEGGFVLIEILVSALVLVIASAGVVTLLQTAVRAQGEERHSSEAYALAQEDQARLASTRLAALNHLDETRTVTLNKVPFKVRSTGVFVNDSTSAPSCGEGTASADYVQITSTVTWAGMTSSEKAKIVSILSPSNGSLDPNNGTIAISVKNQQQVGKPNVLVTGGSGAFSGSTDAAGCAVFPDLPAGDYSTTVSGEAAGLVNKDGNGSVQETLTAVGADVKTYNFEFDVPGTIPVKFKYRSGSSEEFKVGKADSVVAFNTGMTAAKAFWTVGQIREETIEAKPLFPFTSTYLLYAGSCSSNNPEVEKNPGAAPAVANVAAPAGGVATAPILQLPAFDPTVWSGKNEANKGSALANADVWVRDASCTKGGSPVTRRYTTNSSGKLTELGFPWGTYNVCADTEPGSNTSGVRRQRINGVTIQNLLAGTTRSFYLGSGSGTVSESGSCP